MRPYTGKRLLHDGTGIHQAQVTRKLVNNTPPDSLIEAYMEEIARGYGVHYILPLQDSGEGDGGVGVRSTHSTMAFSNYCCSFQLSRGIIQNS